MQRVSKNGRLIRYKGKEIFVASAPNCPSISLTSGTMRFRDDYHRSEISASKRLLEKVASVL